MRRLLDTDPLIQRGNEPLEHTSWESRIKDLMRHLRGRELRVVEICKLMKKLKAWSSIYTKQVIAAAEAEDKLVYSKYKKTWFCRVRFENE